MSYIGISYEPEPSRIQSVTVSSSSSVLPVTVAEVRTYMRLGSSAEDATILTMLKAAIRHIERYINRTIVEREYVVLFDCVGDYTPLPYGPVISVSALSVETDTSTALTDYYLSGDRLIINKYGSISLGWNYGTLKVTYSAGLLKDDETGAVDDDLKQVIIETTALMFERGEAAAGLPKVIKDKLDLIAQERYFK